MMDGTWHVWQRDNAGCDDFPYPAWTFVERDFGAQFREMESGTIVLIPWTSIRRIEFTLARKP